VTAVTRGKPIEKATKPPQLRQTIHSRRTLDNDNLMIKKVAEKDARGGAKRCLAFKEWSHGQDSLETESTSETDQVRRFDRDVMDSNDRLITLKERDFIPGRNQTQWPCWSCYLLLESQHSWHF